MKYAIGTIAICSIIGLSGWWEYSVWNECRTDHSFFYCLRVLSK